MSTEKSLKALEKVAEIVNKLEQEENRKLDTKINLKHKKQFNRHYVRSHSGMIYEASFKGFDPSQLKTSYYMYNRHFHGKYKPYCHTQMNDLSRLEQESFDQQHQSLLEQKEICIQSFREETMRDFHHHINLSSPSNIEEVAFCQYARPDDSLPGYFALPIPKNLKNRILEEEAFLKEYLALNMGYLDCVYTINSNNFVLNFYLNSEQDPLHPILLKSYSWDYIKDLTYEGPEASFWWWFGGIYCQNNESIHTIQRSPVARVEAPGPNDLYEDIQHKDQDMAAKIAWGTPAGSDTPNIMNMITYPRRVFHPGIRHLLEQGQIPQVNSEITRDQREAFSLLTEQRKAKLNQKILERLQLAYINCQNPDLSEAIASLNSGLKELSFETSENIKKLLATLETRLARPLSPHCIQLIECFSTWRLEEKPCLRISMLGAFAHDSDASASTAEISPEGAQATVMKK